MKLARTIRFDASDEHVFEQAAEEGQWAISGSFSFASLSDDQITGKVKQAFANGFLAVPSFGYSTLVSVARASEEDLSQLRAALIDHFINVYGAPDAAAAGAVADDEIAFMAEICAEHKTGTLLSLQRSLTDTGIKEQFRALAKADSCAEQQIWQIVEEDEDDEQHITPPNT